MTTTLERQQDIKYLSVKLDNLPKDDQGFAKSLVQQYGLKHSLSEKQWFWVEKLSCALQGIPDFTETGPEAASGAADRLLTNILGLFEKASQKLKYPAIKFALEDGTVITFKRASSSSSHAGWLFIRTQSGSYLGKISPVGKFFPVSVNTGANLLPALLKINADPAQALSENGKLAGRCCMCWSELTDSKSLAAGYGPTCAKHFGLPWGQQKFSL